MSVEMNNNEALTRAMAAIVSRGTIYIALKRARPIEIKTDDPEADAIASAEALADATAWNTLYALRKII